MKVMKKNKTQENTTVEETSTVETPVVEAPVAVAPTVEVKEKKAPGRPIVAGSKRQLVLQAKAEKIANGHTPKKGRPIVADSNRQIKLAEMNAKRQAGLLKRGRPKMDPIVKAQKAAERAAAKAQAAADAAANVQG